MAALSSAPPGPRGGRSSSNAADYAVDPLGFLTGAAREFGDVVSLTPTNVLLAHPDDIGRVLLDREGRVVKIGEAVRRGPMGFPSAMMNSEGADWERKRARLRPAFRSDRLDHLEHAARDGVARLLDSWHDGLEIDVHDEMSRLAMGVGAVHIAGRPLGERGETLTRAVAAIMRLTSAPRLPMWLPTRTNRDLRRALRDFDAALAALIAENPPGEDAHALGRLLADDPPFPEVRDELATLLMSGYETTANALTWLFHALGANPEAGARMDEPGFASAAAKEAMRLYPPAWVISRETVRPLEVGGYALAAGVTLGLSPWVVHRDGRWFPDPEEFRPERWLNGGRPGHRHAYFPFGAGPRGCLGASMALREVEVIAALLCSRVRLEPVRPEEVRPRPALALQPVGVRAVVRFLG
ncbi:cytochrome P450 [Nocardiopsis sp. N85]|uniref:cytochrome P450 n=1 Tax=Nocardiopsis sp. N85 TaxID=3029400 RepID=UPI00237FD0BC|nr:cytochrome P450 [Nocardiopsis sp. N85]MDE3724965.1 cytochrome P450 [Nocardiopsis sp. N85]